jgi:hypothetical protein
MKYNFENKHSTKFGFLISIGRDKHNEVFSSRQKTMKFFANYVDVKEETYLFKWHFDAFCDEKNVVPLESGNLETVFVATPPFVQIDVQPETNGGG